jgi:hypothetical protein
MLLVGFEFTITEFQRAKTAHALDCEATVIGSLRKLDKANIEKLSNL